ncbi:MAG: hypothetical protein Kow0074_08970 [Candidatus Zixiibacteriota bacterium]
MKTSLLALFLVTLSIVPSASIPALAADATGTPDAAIYDTTANTVSQISDALKLARETNKNVLIQWGANWCVWCRSLHRLMSSDSLVRAVLDSSFVVVLADVGVKGKNADLMAKYGVERKQGIPFLTVLKQNGEVLVNQETGSLETGDTTNKGHDRDKVLRFLRKYTPR